MPLGGGGRGPPKGDQIYRCGALRISPTKGAFSLFPDRPVALLASMTTARRRPDSPRSRRRLRWRGQPTSSRRPATDGRRCSRRTTCRPVSTCTRRRGWGPTAMGNNQRPRSQRGGGPIGDCARSFPLKGAPGLTTARCLGSRGPLQMPTTASTIPTTRRNHPKPLCPMASAASNAVAPPTTTRSTPICLRDTAQEATPDPRSPATSPTPAARRRRLGRSRGGSDEAAILTWTRRDVPNASRSTSCARPPWPAEHDHLAIREPDSH
jgi:hypothetical protein